jgi:catechol 2,3-dioxygenase
MVPAWHTEASTVLDLDGNPVPVTAPAVREAEHALVGADSFGAVAGGTGGQGPAAHGVSSSGIRPETRSAGC